MRQHVLVWRLILEFLLGRKYWVNVIATRGVADRYEMSSFIFSTKEDARRHAESLSGNMTYMWIDTVSFRSRRLM